MNVASRLERVSRRLRTTVVASDEILRALDDRDAVRLRAAFTPAGSTRLRGCRSRRVWIERPDLAARRAA